MRGDPLRAIARQARSMRELADRELDDKWKMAVVSAAVVGGALFFALRGGKAQSAFAFVRDAVADNKSLKAKLQALEKTREALELELDSQKSAGNDRDAALKKVHQLQTEIATLRGHLNENVAKLEAASAAATQQAATMVQKDSEIIILKEARQTAELAASAANDNSKKLTTQLTELQQALRDSQGVTAKVGSVEAAFADKTMQLEAAKEEADGYKKELEATRSERDRIQTRLVGAEATNRTHETEAARAKAALDEAQRRLVDQQQSVSKIAELEAEVTRLTSDVDNLNGRLQTETKRGAGLEAATAEVIQLRMEKTELERQLEALRNERVPDLGAIAELTAENDKLRASVGVMDKLNELLATTSAALKSSMQTASEESTHAAIAEEQQKKLELLKKEAEQSVLALGAVAADQQHYMISLFLEKEKLIRAFAEDHTRLVASASVTKKALANVEADNIFLTRAKEHLETEVDGLQATVTELRDAAKRTAHDVRKEEQQATNKLLGENKKGNRKALELAATTAAEVRRAKDEELQALKERIASETAQLKKELGDARDQTEQIRARYEKAAVERQAAYDACAVERARAEQRAFDLDAQVTQLRTTIDAANAEAKRLTDENTALVQAASEADVEATQADGRAMLADQAANQAKQNALFAETHARQNAQFLEALAAAEIGKASAAGVDALTAANAAARKSILEIAQFACGVVGHLSPSLSPAHSAAGAPPFTMDIGLITTDLVTAQILSRADKDLVDAALTSTIAHAVWSSQTLVAELGRVVTENAKLLLNAQHASLLAPPQTEEVERAQSTSGKSDVKKNARRKRQSEESQDTDELDTRELLVRNEALMKENRRLEEFGRRNLGVARWARGVQADAARKKEVLARIGDDLTRMIRDLGSEDEIAAARKTRGADSAEEDDTQGALGGIGITKKFAIFAHLYDLRIRELMVHLGHAVTHVCGPSAKPPAIDSVTLPVIEALKSWAEGAIRTWDGSLSRPKSEKRKPLDDSDHEQSSSEGTSQLFGGVAAERPPQASALHSGTSHLDVLVQFVEAQRMALACVFLGASVRAMEARAAARLVVANSRFGNANPRRRAYV